MSVSGHSTRDNLLSTLSYWLSKLRKPLCQHTFRVVGRADDRYLGPCKVVRCQRCGAVDRVALIPKDAARA